MELKKQPSAPTLAHELGDVPHVSGLLHRITQLSGAGERVAEWLLKVAIARAGESLPAGLRSNPVGGFARYLRLNTSALWDQSPRSTP